jgi:aryl-alcohol dehydrogenase-like predicted oxidoreductase
LAEAKNATLSQLVVRWTVEQPGITIALVGARNADQAIQNAKAGELKLTPQEIQFISGELAKLKLEI